MDVLELNEICEWAEQHGLECGDRFDVHLPDWPLLHRRWYVASGRLVTLIMANALDAELLWAHGGRVGSVRGTISHHESWVVRGAQRP